jgi:hypothetical protein
MSNKEYYQLYSEHVPIFHQPFWLDIVAENNWDVALVKKEGLVASMPYVMNRSARGTRITMPPLTQFLGPYIFMEESSNYYQKLSSDHQILDELISQFPKFFYFEQRWNYHFKNWLPLYWKGFQQTTKYTYVLNSISEPDKIWKAMKATARNEIKKAEQELSIHTDQDAAGMYQFIKSGLKRKEITIPYSENLLKSLYDQCANRNCGKLYWAWNAQNQPVAGILVVWDKSTCYYLLGSSAETGNNYGLRLLIWTAIQEAGKIVSTFDFEGSMVKGVEHFFRTFGAEQKGYFEITKINSSLLKLKQALQTLRT